MVVHSSGSVKPVHTLRRPINDMGKATFLPWDDRVVVHSSGSVKPVDLYRYNIGPDVSSLG